MEQHLLRARRPAPRVNAPVTFLTGSVAFGDQSQVITRAHYHAHLGDHLGLFGENLKSEFLQDASHYGGEDNRRQGFPDTDVWPQA